MKHNSKNMTLEDLDNRFDDLSTMIAKGFENVDKRFENTATKGDIKGLDQRLDNLEVKVDNLERKVDKVDFRVDQVHEILDRGEKDFLGLQKRVQVLEKINKPQHI